MEKNKKKKRKKGKEQWICSSGRQKVPKPTILKIMKYTIKLFNCMYDNKII